MPYAEIDGANGVSQANDESQPKWFAGVDCANYVSQTMLYVGAKKNL